MKFFKRSYLFIALTLLSVVSNSHAMMTPWSSTIAMVTGSVDLIGSILLGKNAWNALWQSPFPLKNLPKEIQDLIIGLIITGTTSNDLTQAGQAINSLAQVNKELNQLINNPKYSASLIKNLAVQFDATEESVCKALQTLSAKEYLRVNGKIKWGTNNKDYTPLMMAILQNNMEKFGGLLNSPYLIINEQNNQGQTALMVALERLGMAYGTYSLIKIENVIPYIHYLLLYRANPEIADNEGVTPLEMAQKIGNQEVIAKLERVLAKK